LEKLISCTNDSDMLILLNPKNEDHVVNHWNVEFQGSKIVL